MQKLKRKQKSLVAVDKWLEHQQWAVDKVSSLSAPKVWMGMSCWCTWSTRVSFFLNVRPYMASVQPSTSCLYLYFHLSGPFQWHSSQPSIILSLGYHVQFGKCWCVEVSSKTSKHIEKGTDICSTPLIGAWCLDWPNMLNLFYLKKTCILLGVFFCLP